MKEAHGTAADLMEDDHFELAGEMYRVERVLKDTFDNRIITAYPVDGDPIVRISITCDPYTRFLWFNQKQ